MTYENELSFDRAVILTNEIIKRGEKIITSKENVESIRSWIIDNGAEKVQKTRNTGVSNYSETLKSEFNGHTIVYHLEATDPQDPDSVEIFGSVLNVNIDLTTDKNELKSINLSFRDCFVEDDENTEIGETETGIGMVNNLPECRIFAQDVATDQFLDTPWKSMHYLSETELEAVYQFTESIMSVLKEKDSQ